MVRKDCTSSSSASHKPDRFDGTEGRQETRRDLRLRLRNFAAGRSSSPLREGTPLVRSDVECEDRVVAALGRRKDQCGGLEAEDDGPELESRHRLSDVLVGRHHRAGFRTFRTSRRLLGRAPRALRFRVLRRDHRVFPNQLALRAVLSLSVRADRPRRLWRLLPFAPFDGRRCAISDADRHPDRNRLRLRPPEAAAKTVLCRISPERLVFCERSRASPPQDSRSTASMVSHANSSICAETRPQTRS